MDTSLCSGSTEGTDDTSLCSGSTEGTADVADDGTGSSKVLGLMVAVSLAN